MMLGKQNIKPENVRWVETESSHPFPQFRLSTYCLSGPSHTNGINKYKSLLWCLNGQTETNHELTPLVDKCLCRASKRVQTGAKLSEEHFIASETLKNWHNLTIQEDI